MTPLRGCRYVVGVPPARAWPFASSAGGAGLVPSVVGVRPWRGWPSPQSESIQPRHQWPTGRHRPSTAVCLFAARILSSDPQRSLNRLAKSRALLAPSPTRRPRGKSTRSSRRVGQVPQEGRLREQDADRSSTESGGLHCRIRRRVWPSSAILVRRRASQSGGFLFVVPFERFAILRFDFVLGTFICDWRFKLQVQVLSTEYNQEIIDKI